MNNSETTFASARDTFVQSVVTYAGSTAIPKAKEYEVQGSRFYDEDVCDVPKRRVFCRVMGISDDSDVIKLAQSYVCYLKGAKFKKRFNDELNELRKIEFEREFAEKHMYTKEYALLEDQCFRYHDIKEQKVLMLTDEFERELKRQRAKFEKKLEELREPTSFISEQKARRNEAIASAADQAAVGWFALKEADRLAYGNQIDSYVNYQKQEVGNEHKIRCSRDKDWVARLTKLSSEINTAPELSKLDDLSIRTELEDKRDPFLEHGESTAKVVSQAPASESRPKENPILDKPEARRTKRTAGEK